MIFFELVKVRITKERIIKIRMTKLRNYKRPNDKTSILTKFEIEKVKSEKRLKLDQMIDRSHIREMRGT